MTAQTSEEKCMLVHGDVQTCTNASARACLYVHVCMRSGEVATAEDVAAHGLMRDALPAIVLIEHGPIRGVWRNTNAPSTTVP